jgi:DNA-directed RNA polymerase subunit RPC12/RpoP
MPKVMLEGYRCERCGHQWLPRSTTEGDPVICPKCKSPYWNKPRRSETDLARFSLQQKKKRRNE